MSSRSSREILAEKIKKEVMMDLERTYGRRHQEQLLIDSIKEEVLMELERHNRGLSHRDLVETVKREVLAEMEGKKRAGASSWGARVIRAAMRWRRSKKRLSSRSGAKRKSARSLMRRQAAKILIDQPVFTLNGGLLD